MNTFLTLAMCSLMSGCAGDDAAHRYLTLASAEQQATPQIRRYAYIRNTLAGNYLAGRYAQRTQDWKNANIYTSRVLELDPTNMDLQKRTMVLAMGSGKTNRAIAIARDILKKDPENVLALLFISLDAFARQDYELASDKLQNMPEEPITNFIRPLLIAWAESANGKMNIEGLQDNSLHAYHAMLIADYLGKLDKDIVPYLEKALEEPAIDIYELEKIADVHARLGLTTKAVKLYGMIEQQQPRTPNISKKITYLKEGKDINTLNLSSRINAPEQGAAEAMFDMSRVLYRQYSDDSARVFARMALHLNPDMTEVKILLANLMARYERYGDAIEYYRSISEGSDSYIQIQRQAADFMERSDRKDDAIALLQDLADTYGDVESLIQIGDIYRHNENYKDAIKAYNNAADKLGTQIPYRFWHLLYSRGITYERLGKWKEAEADLQAALKHEPDNPYVLNYLGYSWADQGKNLDEALDMIKRAANLRPTDGYIVDSLGWVLYRLDRFEDSIEPLEKAVELLPYDSTINDHLGDAYWRVGRKIEARFQWERALNHSEDPAISETITAKIKNGLEASDDGIREAKSDESRALNP